MNSQSATTRLDVNTSHTNHDALVIEHIPMVRHLAAQVRSHLPEHIETDDLVSAGMIGLLDACRMFRPERNVKFRTYAQIRVRGAMLDSLRASDWASRTLRRKGRAAAEAVRMLTARVNRIPTETEVAEAMGLSLCEYQRLQSDLTRLECRVLDKEQEGQALDKLPASSAIDPFRVLLRHELRDRIGQALNDLPERERVVITLSYYEELSMAEIAEILGVVASRVSQIRMSALMRLRSLLSALDDRSRCAGGRLSCRTIERTVTSSSWN